MTDGVHEWFLQRGLPLVLTRRVRARALIERSAPMVGGLGALVAVLLLLADVTHGRTTAGTRRRRHRLRRRARRHARAAVRAAPRRHTGQRGHPPLGGMAGARAVRAGPSGDRLGLVVDGVGRSPGFRRRVAAGGLVDLPRYRLNCVVGVAVCLGAVRRAGGADERRAAAADDHRAGVLHRRPVAAHRAADPRPAMADRRFPGAGRRRVHGRDHPGRGTRAARGPGRRQTGT